MINFAANLLSTGILAYICFINKKFLLYKEMKEEKEQEEIEELVDKRMSPTIDLCRTNNQQIILVKDYCRYLLTEKCEECLVKGRITANEYSDLAELWKLYSGLGGDNNGQVRDYYEKVSKLPMTA